METQVQVAAEGMSVAITVNGTKVDVPRRVTGAEIKQAAIAAGVPIQPDFVLSVELGGGRTKIIQNDETVQVHEGERFVAVAPDDNS